MTEPDNTRRPAPRYDGGTIALPWPTAALAPGLWLVGTFLEDLAPKGTRRSGMRPGHFDLGFVLGGMTVACLVGRRPGGRDLPVVDPGPLYRLAKATRAALYVLSPVMVGLGIASAFVRGVSLGPISLPQVRDPGWRRSPTHSHRLTANVLMALALFQAVAALVHHYLRHDAVLRRMLPRGS
ncbi:cytochrome b [Methylobacterium radiotolerans]|uniref:cytochrome b n=1 Tax=Methylobacterium TaxID=407 RepID=UPI002F305DF2